VGLTALILALVEGNAWGWDSPEIIALLVMATVGLVAFAVLERRVPEPMVDFSFFRSRTFLGANTVAFIVSFAMLAMFFFIALYMQNILGYDALQAGIRFLPSTLMIVLVAPIAGRLSDRIGPRPLITVGLALTAISMYWQTHIGVDTGYGLLLPSFMIMGVGMALTMSPMSTAAMNAVPVHKSGVASGILSMNRMVGGTFGVAAIGALFQHVSSSRLEETLAGTGVSAGQREQIVDNLGSGKLEDIIRTLDPAVAAQVGRATREAFIHALSSGLWLSAIVAALGAVAAFTLISNKRAEMPDPSREPHAAAEAAHSAA